MITIENFCTYLSGKLSKNSILSYISYLRQCDSTKLPSLSSEQSLLTTLCNNCNSTSSISDRFNIVQNYITESTSILAGLDSSKVKQRKDLTNIRSALRMFSKYVTSDDYTSTSQPVSELSRNPQRIRNQNINQIDGMSILIDLFPEIKHFIEFVLSGCYFFSQDDIKEQHQEIIHHIQNKIPLPARHSTNIRLYKNRKDIKRGSKNVIYNDGFSDDILINIDGNGNASIDKLFTEKTRCYLKGSKSRKPDFINLTISHIWGNAFDPRYFTNLWNIVLVPSFANDILDKPASHDGSYYLGSALLNTLKCILYKLYELDLLNWKDINLNQPTYLSEKVIHGTYKINVFNTAVDNSIPDIGTIEVSI